MVAELMKSCQHEVQDEAGIVALARCMKSKRAQGNITFYISNRDEWQGQSTQFMNDHSTNWLIRSSTHDDEDWLIAAPMPKEKFEEMLVQWFRQPD